MQDIFLNILNMSITAGWLILAVFTLRFLQKGTPKWFICLLWLLVAVRLVCPFTFESIFSVVPSSETIHKEMLISAQPAIDSGMALVDNMINPIISSSFAPKQENSVTPLQICFFIAMLIWIGGMGVMLLYAAIRYLQLYRRVRTAVRFNGSIYISEFVETPFILGIVRPRIYLPSGMDSTILDPVISHEQAHIRRGDHLWKPLGYLLLTVYWFHPLCWIAYSLFCKDLEFACDEKVIKNYSTHQKKIYSEALLACSINPHTISACSLAFGGMGVYDRIKTVLHYKKPTRWMIMAGIITCAAVTICFVTDPRQHQENNPENSRQENLIPADDSGQTAAREEEQRRMEILQNMERQAKEAADACAEEIMRQHMEEEVKQ